MYSYKKLLRLVERMEVAKSEEEIKEIAKKELAIWERITNGIRNIAKKLKNAGILNKEEYDNFQDAYNHCENIRMKLQLIVNPSPYVEKSIPDLIKEMRNSLENEYRKKLEWLIKDLKSKLKHVREEFKLLRIEIGNLEDLD